MLAAGPLWISKTALLETNWVLRSLYGFEESAVCDAFTKLLGLKNVCAEDAACVAAALALTGHGIEFADAIHLSSQPPGAGFVSFDRALVRRAGRTGKGVALRGSTITHVHDERRFRYHVAYYLRNAPGGA